MANHSDNVLTTTKPLSAFGSVLRNSAANFARIGVSWGIALFLPPLLVRVLSKPAYATWILILQIGTYVAFFDNGIQIAVGRFIARAEGMKDRTYMNRMLSSAALVNVVLGVVTAVAAILGCWLLPRVFSQIPPSIISDSRFALLVIGLSLAIGLPFSTCAGTFFGFQMNHVNTVAGSAGKLAGAMGAAWAAYHHQNLFVMALWIAFGNVLQSAIYAAAWKRFAPRDLIRTASLTSGAVREFLHFCHALTITHFGALLITGMDMPVVAKFDFHAAGYYAVAALAGNLIGVPHGAIVSTFIPIASGMSATASPERLGNLVIKLTRLSNGILCLIALPAIFIMPLFLRLWVGADYASHALTFALILTVAQFIRLTLAPYASIGFAAGQQDRMLISPAVEGIVNLSCSLLGVWLWGAIGVAIGTLVGSCAGVLLHFTNSMRRTDSMAFGRAKLAGQGIALPIVCCLPSAALLSYLLSNVLSAAEQVSVIACGELLAIIFLWRFALTVDERRDLATRLARPYLRFTQNRNQAHL